MKKALLTMAGAIAIIVSTAFTIPRAQAMPLSAAAAATRGAADDGAQLTPVDYVCRQGWRFGAYGYGWGPRCWWRPDRDDFVYRPYGFYRPWAYRPYGFYRPYAFYRPAWGYRRAW